MRPSSARNTLSRVSSSRNADERAGKSCIHPSDSECEFLVIIANAWPSYPTTLSGGDGQRVDRDEALSLMGKRSRRDDRRDRAAAALDLARSAMCRVRASTWPRRRSSGIGKLWRKPCAQSLDFIDSKSVFKFHRATELILANQASDANHVYYLSVLKAMCGPEGCPLSIGGEILYADESRLSPQSVSAHERKPGVDAASG